MRATAPADRQPLADRTGEWSPPGLPALQVGRHLIAGALILAGTIRAIAAGAPPGLAIGAGGVLALCYALGSAFALSGLGRSRGSRWWLLGLSLVWIATVAVSPEFVWFAFLLWLLAGHLLPGWWSIPYASAVYVVVVVAPILHQGVTGWANVFGPLIGGVFALGISRGYLWLLRDAAERERLLASLARAQAEAADLQDELALTQRHAGQVSERTRLGRDIHDTVAQSLSSIRLLAHAAITRATETDSVQTFGQIEALARDGIGETRQIIAALTPAELEDHALAAALGRMLDRLHAQTGLLTELHVDSTLPAVTSPIEVALMRTAQSALANVRLHAAASRVVVSLIDDQDRVRLDIIDDGLGFDVPGWEHGSPRLAESGYGLRFMRARLRELGGGLEIESLPGDGTALSAHLPFGLELKGS